MKVLFITGRWAEDIERSENIKILKKIAEVEITNERDQKILADKAEDVDIIITGGPVSSEVINKATNLKMIQTTRN